MCDKMGPKINRRSRAFDRVFYHNDLFASPACEYAKAIIVRRFVGTAPVNVRYVQGKTKDSMRICSSLIPVARLDMRAHGFATTSPVLRVLLHKPSLLWVCEK